MKPDKPRYHITLLRHGQSIGNAKKIWQGQGDFPLTDLGRVQAEARAQNWLAEKVEFDLAIASPLSRAQETAEIITNKLQVPLELDPIWKERDIGRREGLSTEEGNQKFPLPEFIHPYYPIGETGESNWEFFLRGGAAINSLLRRPPGRYLVVSHGGILNMAMYASLGITLQPNFLGPRFHFGNTGYAVLMYTPERHRWQVLRLDGEASQP